FASYYGDHMVLQKAPAGAVVWGYGEPGAAVTVALSGDGGGIVGKKTAPVKGPSGTWTTVLDPMDQGGPYALTARQGPENVTLRDIYFGDVWLCSGQSNMAMTVLQIANASRELAAAARYPDVRVFAAAPARSDVELEDLERIALPWSIPTAAENLGHGNFTYFSAVCWLLGRHLYEALRCPVGLVEVAWGGTPIEAWSSREALRECGLPGNAGRVSALPRYPSSPIPLSLLSHPVIPPGLSPAPSFSGPGEANAFLHTDRYNCTFPALIADWRRAFHTGSAGQTEPLLPFGFVQLSTYRRRSPDDAFARLRWHQTADLGVVPNARMPGTFMAVAMDLCDERSPYGRRVPGGGAEGEEATGCRLRASLLFLGSIHPRDKQNVAQRLQLGARAVAYGEKDLVFQGPYPTGAILEATGAVLNVTYSQELVWRRRDASAFEVCCSSGISRCRWVPAPVLAAEGRTVTLALGGCAPPARALRYAWAEWPCQYQSCALYNTRGLPAPPFL
ncbi:SIAE acetylesterase, partial [Corythaixoides concolor]|nr:SIAE acetylesterase [Corythaixoides concolor]